MELIEGEDNQINILIEQIDLLRTELDWVIHSAIHLRDTVDDMKFFMKQFN